MSSHTNEAPHCEAGHGLMVPNRTKFGYMPNKDGVIHAVIEWEKGEHGMEARIDSVDEATAEFLLEVTRAGDLGEWIDRAVHVDKTLRLYSPFENTASGLYRIDDSRPGCNRTYNVWTDEGAHWGPFCLMHRTVYHYFGPEDEPMGPPLTDFDAVVALMTHPNALYITDVGALAGVKTDKDPRVKARWSLDDRVVVWDIAAIMRNLP